MKPTRKLNRRSFFGRVAGGIAAAGGALTLFAGEARAQVTDADAGEESDPPGQGRTVGGLTDSDTGAFADPARAGRGRRRRGISDGDQGVRADPPANGRGITDADNNDRHGYGHGQARELRERNAPPRTLTGTGFFIAPDGHIVTSHHVVRDARTIFITNAAGTRLPATLVRASASTDIALIRVEHRPERYLTLSSSRGVQSGARVFTVGFPIAAILGREPRYTEGTISALSGPGGDQTFFQVSVPVQPGNSGGPLLSERGEVIGVIAASAAVTTFLQATGTLPQNLNWAVKSDYVMPMVEPAPPVTFASREAAVAGANAAVVYIEVEREPRRSSRAPAQPG